MLTCALMLVLNQPTFYPRPATDERDAVAARIIALDAQLRRKEPTWVVPVTLGGIIVGGLGLGLASYFGQNTMLNSNVLGLMLCGLLGGLSSIGALAGGLFGYIEATTRAELDARRERFMTEYERLSIPFQP